MIVEYIRYKIPETQADEFIAAYGLAAKELDSSPHCKAYELSRYTESAEYFILRIEWSSIDDHLKGFRKSPGFANFFALIKPFFNQIEEMKHYEVTSIQSGTGSGSPR